MEPAEMIGKLHQKTGISLEEAEEVLQRANWDMLEAVLLLEREGKIDPLTASMTTAEEPSGYETVTRTASHGSDAQDFLHRLWDGLRLLFRKSIQYEFFVDRGSDRLLSMPVLVFGILLLSTFSVAWILALAGLGAGCRFGIEKREDKNL